MKEWGVSLGNESDRRLEGQWGVWDPLVIR